MVPLHRQPAAERLRLHCQRFPLARSEPEEEKFGSELEQEAPSRGSFGLDRSSPRWLCRTSRCGSGMPGQEVKGDAGLERRWLGEMLAEGTSSVPCSWGSCRDTPLPGEGEAQQPWSKLPSAAAPVLTLPRWLRRPRPEHSPAPRESSAAAPAAADGAGSPPCRGDRPHGPGCRGEEQSWLLPACSSKRGQTPRQMQGQAGGSCQQPVPAPVCGQSWGCGCSPPQAAGLGVGTVGCMRGSLPTSRASASPQQRGWPGSGQECGGVGWSQLCSPAGICRGVGAPSEAVLQTCRR